MTKYYVPHTPFRPDQTQANSFTAIMLLADVLCEPSERVYPESELRRVADTFNARERPSYGQLGVEGTNALTIDLSRVSHQITKLVIEQGVRDEATGRTLRTTDDRPVVGLRVAITTLPTPNGIMLKKLIESRVELYPMFRGTGRIAEDRTISDLELITIDVDLRQNIDVSNTRDA